MKKYIILLCANIIGLLGSESNSLQNLGMPKGWHPFYEELCKVDENKRRALLESIPINMHFEGKNTLLHLACQNNHIEIIKDLIKYKAKIDALNLNMDTPLHIACKNCDTDIVKLLLNTCPNNINIKNAFNSTPLHNACTKNNLDTIKLLVEYFNADIEARNFYGASPLHNACQYNNIDIVIYLIDKCNANRYTKNTRNETLLHIACEKGYLDLAKILFELKVDINARSIGNESCLHLACTSGNLELVKWLVEDCKIDINILNIQKYTAFNIACSHGHLAIAKFLLQQNPGIKLHGELHKACLKGNLNIVKWLIEEHNLDISYKNGAGDSLLDFACLNNQINVILFLIEHSVPIKKDRAKRYPFIRILPKNLYLLLQAIYLRKELYPNFKLKLSYILRIDFDLSTILLQQSVDIPSNKVVPELKEYLTKFAKYCKIDLTDNTLKNFETIKEFITKKILKRHWNPEDIKLLIKISKENKKFLSFLYSHRQMAKILIKKLTKPDQITFLIKLASQEFDLTKLVDCYGNNLLHIAFQNNKNYVIPLLLTLNSNLILQNNYDGFNPLTYSQDPGLRLIFSLNLK